MPFGSDNASRDSPRIANPAARTRHWRGRTGAEHDKLQDLMVTQNFHDSLPEQVRDHIICRVFQKLVSITQKADIEGLVMG